MTTTLAIETSCDDTSLAVVRYENWFFSVDQIQAYSQIADHQAYGGVVPEIAFRLHSEQILALLQHFSLDARTSIDTISVTTHPWLAWSLLVGKTVAHMLGHHYQKPVIGVNHIHWHLFSLLLERNIADLPFPWVILTASGGHNEIYVVEQKNTLSNSPTVWEVSRNQEYTHDTWDHLQVGPLDHSAQSAEITTTASSYSTSSQIQISSPILGDLIITKLWKTLDDAAGECFDKVARMLGGPYPWWVWIWQQALLGRPNSQYRFKRVLLDGHDNPYDFSFSGMKSQVYTLLQKCEREWIVVAWQLLYDIAYEFQEAIVDVLVQKLTQAAQQYHGATIGIVWWVSANDRLFSVASESIKDATWHTLLCPTKKVYSTDNGAMIGVVGLLLWEK